MILTALDLTPAYRMHVPKWAVAPMSGAGAAKYGGRVNRPGVAALYVCLDSETAVKEYQQVSTLMPPGTLVSYRVSAAPVVDFRGGFDRANWSAPWASFYCDWRTLWFDQHVEPQSWALGDEAIAAGAKGVLFRSRHTAHGTSLALYTDLLAPSDHLEVYDPTRALPKNQDSWR